MRFHGTRRARGIALLLALLLGVALWRVGRFYAEYGREQLGPFLLARLERALGREVRVERLSYDVPGRVVAEGVRIARGATFREGDLLTARHVELRYDPAVLGWRALLGRLAGVDTHAELRAEGVRVLQPAPLPPVELLRAAGARARFDFGRLLRGSEPAAALERVELEAPQLALSRDRDGRWSFEPLLRLGPTRRPSAFRGEIVAHRAEIALTDYRCGSLPAPARQRVVGDLVLQFAAYPLVRFEAEARVAGPHGGRLRVRGHRRAETKRWLATLEGEVAALPYWFRYFSNGSGAVDVLAGRGRISGVLWSHDGGPGAEAPEGGPAYRLALDVEEGAARLALLAAPLRNFRGRLTVEPGLVAFSGAATAAGMPLVGDGELAWGRGGRGRFRLSSERATLAGLQALHPSLRLPEALRERLRVAGPLRLPELRFTGGGQDWSFVGRVEAPEVALQGAPAPESAERAFPEDATATAVVARFGGRIRGGRLEGASGIAEAAAVRVGEHRFAEPRAEFAAKGSLLHADLQAGFLGGAVSARAWLDREGERPLLYLVGTARGLDLERAPLSGRFGERKLDLAGRLSADFVLHGPGEGGWEGSGAVRLLGLRGGEERLDAVAGRIRYAGGRWEIPAATLSDRRFQAALSGSVSARGELDLRLDARGVELARVLAGRIADPVEGRAWLSAAIRGTLEAPVFRGRVQVYAPRYRGQAADYAEARFVVPDARRVELEGLRLLRAPAELIASRVVLTRVPEEGAAAAAGASQQKGADWRIEAEGSLRGLSLAEALRLGGFSSEQLRQQPVAGRLASVRLEVRGPLRTPEVRFDAVVAEAAFRGVALGRVTAAGRLAPAAGGREAAARRVELAAVTAESATLRARASGSILLPEKGKGTEGPAEPAAVRLALRFRAGGVDLLPLLRQHLPRLTDSVDLAGRLAEAEGSVGGTAEAPEVTARVTLEGVALQKEAVAVEPFTLHWMPGALLVEGVRARLGPARLEAPFLGVALGEPSAQGSDRRRAGSERRLVGSIELRDLPLALGREILEASPFFRTERARALREALAEWRAPVTGRLDARIVAPWTGAPPHRAAELRSYLAASPERGLEGTLDVRELASPPALERPLRFSSRFRYAAGALDVPELRLEAAEGEAGPLLRVSGRRGARVGANGAPLEFVAEVRRFRLAWLVRLPVRRLRERIEGLLPLDGEAELTARIAGTERQPSAQFALEVARPVVRGVRFDHFALREGEYSAAEGELRFATARLARRYAEESASGAEHEAEVLVRGALPLRWPGLVLPADAPRRLRVEIPEQSLAVLNAFAEDAARAAAAGEEGSQNRLVSRLLRRIAASGGRMRGEITLGGTAAAPSNDGYFALSGARLGLRSLQTAIEEFALRLDFSGNTVRLTQFEGRSSYGGRFEGEGDIRLGAGANGQPLLNLTIGLERFRFVEKQVGRLVGDSFRGTQVQGTLQTVDPSQPGRPLRLSIAGEWPSPMVAGTLLLDDASLVLAFEALGGAPKVPPGIDPRLQLRLQLGERVWLRNPQLRLRLTGAVEATNTLSEPVIAGQLQASRGSLTLPTLRLRNVEGAIRIAYDGRGRDLGVPAGPPLFVDLSGTTTVRVQRSAAFEAEDYEATFEIRGAPGGGGLAGIQAARPGRGVALGAEGGLTVTVRTDPPLPGDEIAVLIRQQFGAAGIGGPGANVVEALREQIEEAFAVNVASALTGRIEEKLEAALGLSHFSIDLGVSQPLRVRLGKRLFGPVYGTITQQFGGAVQNQRRLEVYYRINPQFRIGYRQEEPANRRTLFFSGTFSF